MFRSKDRKSNLSFLSSQAKTLFDFLSISSKSASSKTCHIYLFIAHAKWCLFEKTENKRKRGRGWRIKKHTLFCVSATRWSEGLFNIWPILTMKIYPMAYQVVPVSFKCYVVSTQFFAQDFEILFNKAKIQIWSHCWQSASYLFLLDRHQTAWVYLFKMEWIKTVFCPRLYPQLIQFQSYKAKGGCTLRGIKVFIINV